MIAVFQRLGSKLRLDRPPSHGMPEALQWMMLFRVGVAFFVLGLVVFLQVVRQEGPAIATVPIYSILAAAFAFNLLTLLVIDRLPDSWMIIASQVFFDSTLISMGIGLTSGRVSLFALFYLIQILSSALIFVRRGAWIAAVGAAFGFGVIQMRMPSEGAFFDWTIFAGLFVIISYVGGYLSSQLVEANTRLEQKRRGLQKMIALQERILSDLPTGVLTLDGQGLIGFVNPAAAQILHRKAETIIGKALSEVEPGLLPFFEKIDRQAVGEQAVGESHHSFYMNTRNEYGMARLQQRVEIGRAKDRILRGDVAQIEADHELEGVLGSGAQILLFQEVTRLIRLEEKVKQNEKLAAVGQLAAGIAHEIRNPLASMSASIEMLKDSVPTLGGENQKLMEIAIREIDRLNRLISEFLDFVKPDKFKFATLPLENFLSELVLSARALKEAKERIQFSEKYEKVSCVADSAKLRQVIWNLIINAIQATQTKGTIEVGCTKINDTQAMLWIQDTGAGMSEEVLSHLYEPFFTTKDKGTGLGLATAYKIIEAHKGEMRVTSQEGKGTRFEVVLPLANS